MTQGVAGGEQSPAGPARAGTGTPKGTRVFWQGKDVLESWGTPACVEPLLPTVACWSPMGVGYHLAAGLAPLAVASIPILLHPQHLPTPPAAVAVQQDATTQLELCPLPLGHQIPRVLPGTVGQVWTSGGGTS